MRTYFTLALALVSASCHFGEAPNSEDFATQSASQQIIGGVNAEFDDAVVAVFVGGLCTGTLVAPRVVLTAAHCVGDAIRAGRTRFGRVSFGDGRGPWIDSIDIVDMTMHRLYNPPAFLNHDIALVRLARPAPVSITPIPISTQNLTNDDIGLPLRVVGFGNTDGIAGTGAGQKRQARFSLREVNRGHIGFGDQRFNTCQGDSGGPTFATFGGNIEYVVGVTSYGSNQCRARSYMTRTDVMWDEFLTEVISAWSGACQNDGECVEDPSCPFADPDCDPCGMDGVCVSGCARPDRDCELGGLAGDSCQEDTDCEARLCVTAPEDSRIRFCSTPCDPNLSGRDSECKAPLTICSDQQDGLGACDFPGITPGAMGANCQASEDCRSGLCDRDNGICLEPCGGDLSECSDGFSCVSAANNQKVCALGGESGGCSSGSSGSGILGSLFLLLILGWTARRRSSSLLPLR